MSDQLFEVATQDQPCFDPECFGIAEAETDQEYTWYTCNECSSEFGFEKVEKPATAEPACQMGVSESLRKIGSLLDAKGLPSLSKSPPTSVPVTLTSKPSR